MPYVLRGLLSFTSTIMAAAGYTTGSVSVTYVTVPSMEIAKTLSSKIVSSKLAACVNIIPGVLSVYEWKGKVENDNELLLMIKTRTSLINELSNFVKANHPYEVPEVISLPVENGHLPYLDWVRATTKDNWNIRKCRAINRLYSQEYRLWV